MLLSCSRAVRGALHVCFTVAVAAIGVSAPVIATAGGHAVPVTGYYFSAPVTQSGGQSLGAGSALPAWAPKPEQGSAAEIQRRGGGPITESYTAFPRSAPYGTPQVTYPGISSNVAPGGGAVLYGVNPGIAYPNAAQVQAVEQHALRCAQLQAQLFNLVERQSLLVSARAWSPLELAVIENNFQEAARRLQQQQRYC